MPNRGRNGDQTLFRNAMPRYAQFFLCSLINNIPIFFLILFPYSCVHNFFPSFQSLVAGPYGVTGVTVLHLVVEGPRKGRDAVTAHTLSTEAPAQAQRMKQLIAILVTAPTMISASVRLYYRKNSGTYHL